MQIVADLIMIVIAGLFGGLLARKFHQPIIIGYILAGVAVGPYTVGATVVEIKQVEGLAEIGVALLLFSLGLEFSLSSLKPIFKMAVWGTLLQVAVTFAGGLLIGHLMHWSLTPSLWFAVAFVSTSTAVVLKTLTSQGQLGTLCSQVMLGVSIIQDLTVIPLMILLLNLSKNQGDHWQSLTPLLTGILFVLFVLLAVARLAPWLLKHVAQRNSQELFLLCVTGLALGIGYISQLLGLSLAFGAFLTGLVLSDSDYSKKALSELVPVRDLFALLFFVSVGMLLDPRFLFRHWGTIVLLMLAANFCRSGVLAIISRLMGYRNVIPLAMLLGMLPASEIAFVVIMLGLSAGVIDQNTYSLILSIVILSMIVGPIMSGLTDPVYSLLKRYRRKNVFETINLPTEGLYHHIVITGGSLAAEHIARLLQKLELPYILIEANHHFFMEAKRNGLCAIFGDSRQETILNAAIMRKARLLLITSGGLNENVEIIRNARHINPDIAVITQAEGDEEIEILKKLNITELIQPDFEAGLEMTRQALLKLDLPPLEIQNYLDEVRRRQYAPIYQDVADDANRDLLEQLRSAMGMLDLCWVMVPPNSPLDNVSLGQSRIRSRTGVSVVGVMRNGIFTSNPTAEFKIQAHDYLSLLGTTDQRCRFEELFGLPTEDTGDMTEKIEVPL